MKYHMKTIAAVMLLSIAGHALPPVTARPCSQGGGGGTPMINISEKFKKQYFPIKTTDVEESVSEYLYWERSHSLVYRTEEGAIKQKFLNSVTEKLKGYLFSPMSRLLDIDEKYINVANETRFLDFTDGYWYKFSTKYPVNQHLFWAKESGEDVLYSLSAQYNTLQALQTLIIYRYGKGDKQPSSCQLYGNQGERFYVGKGNSFPYVFLYKTAPAEYGGTNVSFYRVAVNQKNFPVGATAANCKPESLTDEPIWVPGQVETAYHLPAQNDIILTKYSSFAVKTTDPTDNLIWIYRTTPFEASRCLAFDFGGRDHFVLNTKRSLVTTWSRDEGITLVFPQEQQQAQIFDGLELEDLTESDFTLADNLRIFVAGRTHPLERKRIYVSDLLN